MPTTGAGLGRELKLILDLLLREREREGGEKRGKKISANGRWCRQETPVVGPSVSWALDACLDDEDDEQ